MGATVRFIFKMILWDFVLFQLGRIALLAVTLGRYPTRRDCAQAGERIQLTAMATLLVLWLAVAVFNNLHG